MTPDYYPPSWMGLDLGAAECEPGSELPEPEPPRVVFHVPRRGTVWWVDFGSKVRNTFSGEDHRGYHLAVPAQPKCTETWCSSEAVARDTVAGWPLFPADQLTLF